MSDVIFYEAFEEEECSLRKYLGGLTAEFRQHSIQSYDDPAHSLVSIRTHSRIPPAWYGQVKGILSRSSGYDHLIDFLEKTKGQIPCGYLSDYCARSVAEHAITVMLALFKKLKKQMDHFSTFNRNGLTCKDCFNKNLLVVGVGKIGSQIVHLGKRLDMNVKGVDLVERFSGVDYVDLAKGISWADAIICALPLTSLTEGLLNKSMLNINKRNPLFINISRCEISPLNDLAQLLDEGVLAGIGLDVFENEGKLSLNLSNIILSLKDRHNVIFTPHNAFNTEESLDRKSKQSCESIQQFLQTGHFPDEVNHEASEYTHS